MSSPGARPRRRPAACSGQRPRSNLSRARNHVSELSRGRPPRAVRQATDVSRVTPCVRGSPPTGSTTIGPPIRWWAATGSRPARLATCLGESRPNARNRPTWSLPASDSRLVAIATRMSTADNSADTRCAVCHSEQGFKPPGSITREATTLSRKTSRRRVRSLPPTVRRTCVHFGRTDARYRGVSYAECSDCHRDVISAGSVRRARAVISSRVGD